MGTEVAQNHRENEGTLEKDRLDRSAKTEFCNFYKQLTLKLRDRAYISDGNDRECMF